VVTRRISAGTRARRLVCGSRNEGSSRTNVQLFVTEA
jgi:hypothetical protein